MWTMEWRDAVGNTHRMLKEVIDVQDDVTEEDISLYARQIGIDPEKEPELLWIAKQGLTTPIPKPWCPVEDGLGRIYYYNTLTDQSSWEHPLDSEFRALAESERQKRGRKESASNKSKTFAVMSDEGTRKSYSVRFDMEDDDFADLDDLEDSYQDQETEDVTLEKLPLSDDDDLSARLDDCYINLRPGVSDEIRISVQANHPEESGSDARDDISSEEEVIEEEDIPTEEEEEDDDDDYEHQTEEEKEAIEAEQDEDQEEREEENDVTEARQEENDEMTEADEDQGEEIPEDGSIPVQITNERDSLSFMDLIGGETDDDKLDLHIREIQQLGVTAAAAAKPLLEKATNISLEDEERRLCSEAEEELKQLKQRLLSDSEKAKSRLLASIREEEEAYLAEEKEKIKAEMEQFLTDYRSSLQAENEEKVGKLRQTVDEKYRQIENEIMSEHEERLEHLRHELDAKLESLINENSKIIQQKEQELNEKLKYEEAAFQLKLEEERKKFSEDYDTNLQKFRADSLNKEALIKNSETAQALKAETDLLKGEVKSLKKEVQDLLEQKHEVLKLRGERDVLCRQLQTLRDEISREQAVLEELEKEKVALVTNIKTHSDVLENVSQIGEPEENGFKDGSDQLGGEGDKDLSASSEIGVHDDANNNIQQSESIPLNNHSVAHDSDAIESLKRRMSSFESHMRILGQKLDKVLDSVQRHPSPESSNREVKQKMAEQAQDLPAASMNCAYCDKSGHQFSPYKVNNELERAEEPLPSELFQESTAFMNDLPVVMNELVTIQRKMDDQFKALTKSVGVTTSPRKFGHRDLQSYSASSDNIDKSLKMIHRRVKDMQRRKQRESGRQTGIYHQGPTNRNANVLYQESKAAQNSSAKAVDENENKDDAKPGTSNGNFQQPFSRLESTPADLPSSTSSESLSDLSCFSASSGSMMDEALEFNYRFPQSEPLMRSSHNIRPSHSWKGPQQRRSRSTKRMNSNPVLKKFVEKTKQLDEEVTDLENIEAIVSNALKKHGFQEFSNPPINITVQPQKLVNAHHLRHHSSSLPCIPSLDHLETRTSGDNIRDHQVVLRKLRNLNRDINSMLEQMALPEDATLQPTGTGMTFRSPAGGSLSTLPPLDLSQMLNRTGGSLSHQFTHRENTVSLASNSSHFLSSGNVLQKDYEMYMEPIQKLRQELKSLQSSQ